MRRLAAALAVLTSAVTGCGGGSEQDEPAAPPLRIAVIGDTPYGDQQEAAFPRLVDAINGHFDLDLVLHVGDIKTGGSTCSAQRFRRLRGLFDTFDDPLVYTPGDNEWTDCHRARAGGYAPEGRLALLRRTFYPRPGMSLGGRSMQVRAQSFQRGFAPFVENQLWTARQVVFSTVHVVGSNNGRDLRRGREAFERRLAAALAWLDRTFEAAARPGTKGVVIALHADMFAARAQTGFSALIQRLRRRAKAFDGPVLLLNGDTHRYRVEQPIADAPNLTQLVVQGETTDEWLRLEVDPQTPEVFFFARRSTEG